VKCYLHWEKTYIEPITKEKLMFNIGYSLVDVAHVILGGLLKLIKYRGGI
jgi:hypothetical protein